MGLLAMTGEQSTHLFFRWLSSGVFEWLSFPRNLTAHAAVSQGTSGAIIVCLAFAEVIAWFVIIVYATSCMRNRKTQVWRLRRRKLVCSPHVQRRMPCRLLKAIEGRRTWDFSVRSGMSANHLCRAATNPEEIMAIFEDHKNSYLDTSQICSTAGF